MVDVGLNTYLKKIYYDERHPAGYGSINSLYRQARTDGKKYTMKQIREWLEGQETYTLHKPIRKRFRRNRIIVSAIDEQWEVDLSDLSSMQEDNDGYGIGICFAVSMF